MYLYIRKVCIPYECMGQFVAQNRNSFQENEKHTDINACAIAENKIYHVPLNHDSYPKLKHILALLTPCA